MTLYSNDPGRTGLADGTVITTANSGGGTNVPFGTVYGTPQMSTTHFPSTNVASYHVSPQTGTQEAMRMPLATTAASNALRLPFQIVAPVNPSSAQILVQLGPTGQNYIGIAATGKPIVVLQGVGVHTAAAAITAGWWWLEVWWEIGTTSNFHYKLYPDDGVFTTVDSYDSTSVNTGTTQPNTIYFGKQTASGNWTDLYFGTLAVNVGGVAFMGLPAANSAPTANAGPDQSNIPAGSTVTLNGTGSSDPDGDPITYLWTQTAGSTATLDDPTAAQPQLVAPATATSQTVTYSLVVTDNKGLSSSPDTVNINITTGTTQALQVPVGINDVSITSAGATLNTITGPKPINTSDGDLLVACLVERNTGGTLTPPAGWTTDTGAGITTGIGSSQIWHKKIPDASAETATSYTFTWTGGTARASLIIFRIIGTDPANALDSVGSFSATTGTSTITVPADTTVAAKTVVIVWTVANRTDTTHPQPQSPSATWQDVAQVDYDNGSASTGVWVGALIKKTAGSTGALTVPVSPSALGGSGGVMLAFKAANAAISNAGADQSGLEPYATVTLDGTGSTPRAGQTLTYAWTQTAGTPVTLSSATAASPTFTAPPTLDGDVLTFQLVVNDGTTSLPDTTNVTVLPHTVWRLEASGTPSPIQVTTL